MMFETSTLKIKKLINIKTSKIEKEKELQKLFFYLSKLNFLKSCGCIKKKRDLMNQQKSLFSLGQQVLLTYSYIAHKFRKYTNFLLFSIFFVNKFC